MVRGSQARRAAHAIDSIFIDRWAHRGGALVLFISKITLDDARVSRTQLFDTGAAWENFALQGSLRNLVVHGMLGFDHDRARSELKVPQDFQVDAMAAVGKPGEVQQLPENLRPREQPSDRRPLNETVCAGAFSF